MKEEIKYLHNGILMNKAEALNSLQEKIAEMKQLDETYDSPVTGYVTNF